MATVFLAHDIKHDRPVALKVLHPELAAALGAERFLREVRIAAHLQHPHILTLIDSGEIPGPEQRGVLYYVMPYVDGENLRERLTRDRTLSPAETLRILHNVLDALAHAHRQKIVHRDIKPENIMVSGRHALVMDFGIAKAATAAAAAGEVVVGGTLTTLGLAIGTPSYMAPEQAAGQTTLDARADLYAVGVLAYEMLSGQPPFTGPSPQAIVAAHITRTPAPLGPLRPDLAPSFADAIMRCLEKEPDARWQSAEELLAQLESFATPGSEVTSASQDRSERTQMSRRWLIGAVMMALIIGGMWYWFWPKNNDRGRQWAREEAIPRMLALTERGQWDSAYVLARQVQARSPGDSVFRSLLPRFARIVNLHTDPPGATVWRKDYTAPDSTWMILGKTPLDSALLSLSGGGGLLLNANRIRIEAPGYRTLDLVGMPFGSEISLDRDSALPSEMVRAAGGNLTLEFPMFQHVKPLTLGDFLMDRFEVTNAEFKRFVDSGGYRRRELWEHPFVKDGRVIPWSAAMASMTDRTAQLGPSTWEGGDYPAGQEKHPVAGVSWYEAAAFAKFAGKSLPTVFHWNRAATVRNSAWIVPLSNFSGQGTRPVGTSPNISGFGTYDMAGNVREWCLNAAGSDRFILGGGWTDHSFQFNDSYTQAPFDRSAANGIRLVKYLGEDPNLGKAGESLDRVWRDFLKERPVPDPVFAAYLQMYHYDRTPLNAKLVESVDEGDWVRELVRMDAAYADDSLLAYVYLPKRGVKPYPAVVYFPPGSAIRGLAPQNLDLRSIDFVIKSGRAVLYPLYKGTYQRRDSLQSDTQDSTNLYRDHVVMWAKDLGRGIDYLETRPDVATDKLAFYGLSWGGQLGALMPAVEPRIRVSVLVVAGLDFPRTRPEVEPLNFVTRVRIPTLMLNGRYDFFFPVESSQLPMFRLLGTPPDQKRHVIEEGSHFLPRARMIQETLAWLDKYQPKPK